MDIQELGSGREVSAVSDVDNAVYPVYEPVSGVIVAEITRRDIRVAVCVRAVLYVCCDVFCS